MLRTMAMVAALALLVAACSTAAHLPRMAQNNSAESAPSDAGSAAARETAQALPRSFLLPTEDGQWTPPQGAHSSDKASGLGTIDIVGVGRFQFETSEVETLRPDIFRPGHFSLFDALAHVAQQGNIELEYHFSDALDTHLVDRINGQSAWWYSAFYSGGWGEANVFRMDMFPYKDGTTIRLQQRTPDELTAIYATFEAETQRRQAANGRVVIPSVSIRSPAGTFNFEDVVVTAHNVRSDALQPGVVTALDAIISLAEQGELSALKLTWYDTIASADPVQHYFVERIGDAEAFGTCGFVYETGPQAFAGFSGTHIHIPSDMRVTVSPDYALWFWICL